MLHLAQAAAVTTSSLVGPLINLGAVGVCLVVLGYYYVRKDKKYDARIDEQIAAANAFRQEQCQIHEKYQSEFKEVLEKYRTALEKFGTTLDSVIGVLRGKGGPS